MLNYRCCPFNTTEIQSQLSRNVGSLENIAFFKKFYFCYFLLIFADVLIKKSVRTHLLIIGLKTSSCHQPLVLFSETLSFPLRRPRLVQHTRVPTPHAFHLELAKNSNWILNECGSLFWQKARINKNL